MGIWHCRLQSLYYRSIYRLYGKYTANICGHKTRKIGPSLAFDETVILQMPLAKNGRPDYCLDCIGKMAIKCAWCSGIIRIGDPVTLYTPSEQYVVPDHAVRYDQDPQCLVGCLRFDCCAVIERQGLWLPPGKVRRVTSFLEMLQQDPDIKMIVASDISDPSAPITIIK